MTERITTSNSSTTLPKKGDTIPAVCIRDMYFTYQKEYILENVNLDIFAREFVSIIGPNGSGKTTLLKLMLGLLQPQKGNILIFGEKPERNRDRIGYVPQYFQLDMSFPATVLEVVLMGLVHKQQWLRFSASAREKARDALDIVGLGSLSKEMFCNLSGGQRQRVLIARALVSQPKILLFDEPTAHVDTVAEKNLMDLLKQISRELTVILVSHDLGVVSEYVDTVVCVNRTVQKHPTNELTGAIIRELYGSHIELVHHGFIHIQERHNHE
ncbi:MAG TPA: ABC transporter ATP-binding protein [Candidatus Hydrogenedens sp.]|nr:ABC transporter ATP-binding protein [Candidatus Hydrogenedens sp.]HOL18759.1 ABC transporter ATP-binding protein [Candidatus Hydrogenedens sp.]HPP59091.1 ABC transporter ATP-binding protein [Candidatus Hydrogenedens sp.]